MTTLPNIDPSSVESITYSPGVVLITNYVVSVRCEKREDFIAAEKKAKDHGAVSTNRVGKLLQVLFFKKDKAAAYGLAVAGV